jgi:phosphomannomutase
MTNGLALQEHKIREKMVKILQEKFASRFNLKFSIGGQISFDVFPIGKSFQFRQR